MLKKARTSLFRKMNVPAPDSSMYFYIIYSAVFFFLHTSTYSEKVLLLNKINKLHIAKSLMARHL